MWFRNSFLLILFFLSITGNSETKTPLPLCRALTQKIWTPEDLPIHPRLRAFKMLSPHHRAVTLLGVKPGKWLTQTYQPDPPESRTTLSRWMDQVPSVTSLSSNSDLFSPVVFRRLLQEEATSERLRERLTREQTFDRFKKKLQTLTQRLQHKAHFQDGLQTISGNTITSLETELAASLGIQNLRSSSVEHNLLTTYRILRTRYLLQRGFTQERIQWIDQQEETLPQDRMIFYQIENPLGWLEESVRLFEGGLGIPMPWEIHTGKKAKERAENPMMGLLEIGRGLSESLNPIDDAPFKAIFTEIATYVDVHYIRQGLDAILFIHTDGVGRRRFSRVYGFQDYDSDIEKDEYDLFMPAREFIHRFGTRYPFWKEAQRLMGSNSVCNHPLLLNRVRLWCDAAWGNMISIQDPDFTF